MMHALDIASDVRAGRVTAIALIERCLPRLEGEGRRLGAVTNVLAERARHEALAIDAQIAVGADPGPLAGVVYGVKDLFDIAGRPTTAGSAIYADAPPAAADAEAIVRLRAAGAVLIATLNMDEFAYGFATINARHGTTRNPHDPARLAGGSSGGSAAAVAAGLLPFALGSDTNGSVRVPASLTGTYGIKPTHGTLPMEGVFPFAESFDDTGPFAASIADLELIWQILRQSAPAAPSDAPLRIARLGGRFAQNTDPQTLEAIAAIAPDAPEIVLPDIARARSAAFLITAYEGGRLHREELNTNAMAFDPATRDRLLAGALIPRALYEAAQAFRQMYRETIAALIADYDVLLAPAAPCAAPLIADPRIMIDGELRPARSDLGIHTQPISFMGLPALAVPMLRTNHLPLGLQLIGQHHGEAALFRFAKILEDARIIGFSLPSPETRTQGEYA